MSFKISPKMLEKEASEEQMNEPNKELAQQVAILTAQVKKKNRAPSCLVTISVIFLT